MEEIMDCHPYNLRYDIPDGTLVLIVGTAPPPRFTSSRCRNKKSCKCREDYDFDFFYGSGRNNMWPFLEKLADKSLFHENMTSASCSSVAQNFLRQNNLWMRDVLQIFRRKHDKSCSAKDSDIVTPALADCTDFKSIFETHTSVKKISFTSEQAAKWTFKKLEQQELVPKGTNILSEIRLDNKNYINEKYLKPRWHGSIEGREISFFLLPSPSSSAWRAPLSEKDKLTIYEKVLLH